MFLQPHVVLIVHCETLHHKRNKSISQTTHKKPSAHYTQDQSCQELWLCWSAKLVYLWVMFKIMVWSFLLLLYWIKCQIDKGKIKVIIQLDKSLSKLYLSEEKSNVMDMGLMVAANITAIAKVSTFGNTVVWLNANMNHEDIQEDHWD